jgi:hypothetical protein
MCRKEKRYQRRTVEYVKSIIQSTSQLRQSLRLRLDSRPQVNRVRWVTARHHGQFASGIIDKHAGELVAANDFLDGFAGLAVA